MSLFHAYFTIFENQLRKMKYSSLMFFFISISVFSQSDFDTAVNYFNSKQYEAAKSIFEKKVQQNPSDLKSIEFLGDIQSQYKNWDNAIFYYQKLKVSNPNEANYFYKYGGALGMKAKESNKFKALMMMDDIKSSFEKAIKLNPKHIEARWALIEVYIQLPSIVGGSQEKAIQYSNELLKISPVDGCLSKGHIYEYYKKYDLAEIQYQKAISIGNSKNSYQKLADLYKNKMNLPQKAKQTLITYNEINKT